jgi:hypothetical protein
MREKYGLKSGGGGDLCCLNPSGESSPWGGGDL